ncbi:hypothetical protein GGS23DRAFT_407558 [Durotheca rogersii]|uniref:uncharacterized protein n=1 Tax=Durotheca rogersii TaxID=419775 RepID=UPI00221FF642|nr:uncharacterized protein GGS23DRAFT_407558 [Durotheca rogersii]KAI5865074.1 hypothetical protein GGS23DRAFT_407558 [Durotheca rogersii]
MPPINHAAISVGVVAISVAVAAAVAIYESPELQRMANDLRRRIAIALHSLGDNISPAERENLFNRPEDAEGFLRSRGFGPDGEPGVDADDETRRRQREELMYWNAVLEKKRGTQRGSSVELDTLRPQGTSFDDFMRQDADAEKGTYVVHTGSEHHNTEGLVRRRGDGARGLTQSIYTDPFADEHGIDDDIAFENGLMDPEKDELASDIYSTSTVPGNENQTPETATLAPSPVPAASLLVDLAGQAETAQPSERELGPDEYMTAGQDDRHDAYSSIQAWAHEASTAASFYSPLPESPASPLSEAELVSDGVLTPTDSASLAGSGEDIADEAASARSWNRGRSFDVMSDDEGMATPASWTEVGSVVSDNEDGAVHA